MPAGQRPARGAAGRSNASRANMRASSSWPTHGPTSCWSTHGGARHRVLGKVIDENSAALNVPGDHYAATLDLIHPTGVDTPAGARDRRPPRPIRPAPEQGLGHARNRGGEPSAVFAHCGRTLAPANATRDLTTPDCPTTPWTADCRSASRRSRTTRFGSEPQLHRDPSPLPFYQRVAPGIFPPRRRCVA